MAEDSPSDKMTALPAGRHAPSIVLFAIVTVALLAADLVSKSLSFQQVAGSPVPLVRDESGHLPPIPAHEPIVIVPWVLALHLTANEGAVFGLGRGGRWLFVAFSIIAAGIIVSIFSRSSTQSKVLHAALAAVLAGALGNLYDRLLVGVVRDMIWLFPGVELPFGWRWPDGSDGLYPWIFNVADVCLVLGLIVLLVLMYRHERRIRRAQRAAQETTSRNASRP